MKSETGIPAIVYTNIKDLESMKTVNQLVE